MYHAFIARFCRGYRPCFHIIYVKLDPSRLIIMQETYVKRDILDRKKHFAFYGRGLK